MSVGHWWLFFEPYPVYQSDLKNWETCLIVKDSGNLIYIYRFSKRGLKGNVITVFIYLHKEQNFDNELLSLAYKGWQQKLDTLVNFLQGRQLTIETTCQGLW